MTTPVWQPSTTYVPGAIVRPTASGSGTPLKTGQPDNADFESGATDWTLGSSTAIATDKVFSGTQSLKFTGTTSATVSVQTVSIDQRAVIPGQSVSAACKANTGGNSGGASVTCVLWWYDAGGANIGQSAGTPVVVSGGAWQSSSVTASAPAGAAKVAIAIAFIRESGSTDSVWGDSCSWNYQPPLTPAGLLYKAVQTAPGKSAGTEPKWPSALGVTVVDNQVTWEAVQGTLIEWTASPLNISGGMEPVWPTTPGALLNDNGVTWLTSLPLITDANCPNSRIATIAANKVFVGDADVVRFCATNNAQDWTAQNDAGYLPTGLNSDQETSCTALGLYRGNVVAFTASAMQLWQVDPDPAAMAFLDKVDGIGVLYARGLASIQGDLYFLTTLGVRSASISAGTANLQAGDIGTPIDPLVQADFAVIAAAIALGERPDWEPLGVYLPSSGQYWISFGDHAWVFTYSPSAQIAAWSKYTLPFIITDVAVLNGDLYVRADNNNVYRLDKEAEWNGDAMNDDGTAYQVLVRWPYLDYGNSGGLTQLVGFDALFDEKVVNVPGATQVSVAYDENNQATFTTPVPMQPVSARAESGYVPVFLMAPSTSMQITYQGDGMWEFTQFGVFLGAARRAP